MLIIGSMALEHHLYCWGDAQDFHHNFFNATHKRNDMDVICTIKEYEEWIDEHEGMIVQARPSSGGDSMYVELADFSYGHDRTHNEFYIAWPGTTNEAILKLEKKNEYASLNTLLLLKMSHRYKKNSPHFQKTRDSIKLLRSMGATIEGMEELLAAREKETYTYSHPKLNKSKKDFFNEVDKFYKYEHDDIHKAVAVEDQPAYTLFSTSGEEVKSSKRLWNKCELRTKLRAGLEESYVLAIERSLVPHPGVLTRRQAFDKALEKVCTSITSGWFREFCWENYDGISSLYNDNYFDKFTEALERGEIKEYIRE